MGHLSNIDIAMLVIVVTHIIIGIWMIFQGESWQSILIATIGALAGWWLLLHMDFDRSAPEPTRSNAHCLQHSVAP